MPQRASAAFWRRVFAAQSGTHFFKAPGSRLYLRLEIDPDDGPLQEDHLGYAWLSARRRVHPAEGLVRQLEEELYQAPRARRPPIIEELQHLRAELPDLLAQLRLEFTGERAVTLAHPNDMSVLQWSPQGAFAGSSYEGDGGGPATRLGQPARDAWLDAALKRMVAEFQKLHQPRRPRRRR